MSSVRSSSCCSACSFLMPRSVTYVNDRSSFLIVLSSTMKSMSLSVAHVRSSDASTMTPSLSRATEPPRCSMRSMACATAGESCFRACAVAPAAHRSRRQARSRQRDKRVRFSFSFSFFVSILLRPPPRAHGVEAPVDLRVRQRLFHAVEPLLGQLCVVQVEVLQIFLRGQPRQRFVRQVGPVEPEVDESRCSSTVARSPRRSRACSSGSTLPVSAAEPPTPCPCR